MTRSMPFLFLFVALQCPDTIDTIPYLFFLWLGYWYVDVGLHPSLDGSVNSVYITSHSVIQPLLVDGPVDGNLYSDSGQLICHEEI